MESGRNSSRKQNAKSRQNAEYRINQFRRNNDMNMCMNAYRVGILSNFLLVKNGFLPIIKNAKFHLYSTWYFSNIKCYVVFIPHRGTTTYFQRIRQYTGKIQNQRVFHFSFYFVIFLCHLYRTLPNADLDMIHHNVLHHKKLTWRETTIDDLPKPL